jgi:hypothetical protein
LHHHKIAIIDNKMSMKHLVALALAENIGVLLEWGADELGLLPQVGGEETVGVGDGNEGGFEGVLEGLGRTGGGGVDVGDTSQLQQTLDGWGGDEAGTARSWDELEITLARVKQTEGWIYTYTNGDGTALSGLLDGDGVRVTKVGSPVSATNWHNAELGDDDGSADGGSDFLAGLDAQTDVAGAVSDNDDSLKASALTGTGLLLDGLDL